MKLPVLAAFLLICLVFLQGSSAASRHVRCARCGCGSGGYRPQFGNNGGLGIINANGAIGNGNGNIGGGANSKIIYRIKK